MGSNLKSWRSEWLLSLGVGLIGLYGYLFLHAESQIAVFSLCIVGAAATWTINRLRNRLFETNIGEKHPRLMGSLAIAAIVLIGGISYDSHFALLMLTTLLLYTVVCLGLNIQFGYCGIVNFAGAAFFGIGGYTAAVFVTQTPMPHILIIFLGGAISALLGSLLILPVLRTRGHYAALVTIAFGILFKTFLEVNDTLGGPQGLRIPGMEVFGWKFNDNIALGDVELSFYLNYLFLAIILCAGTFVLVRRLERSWLGLSMDVVRVDEIAARTFGVDISHWKIIAFTFGNFLAGTAGALYGMMTGYVAPNNFTFGDSLILVSIVVLGGIGNPWGILPAAAIVLILPEKLQFIQEYRFLLYALLVILILLFRPDGLLPRKIRTYFPGVAR